MPPKKKVKKIKKLKKRPSGGTNIKITIDNSRKTQARKSSENKPKGHVNIPINYFPQFTPARPVITDISPNQGFNTVNLEKINNEYQTQFKNYFEGKLSEFEKKMLEESEKKNTAPPRPEMAKPGASHQYTDYDGETVYQEPIQKQPTNIHGKMIDELKTRLKGITNATPIGKPQNANIAEAKPMNPIQSTNITELNSVVPFADVEPLDRKAQIQLGKEAQKDEDEETKATLVEEAIRIRQYNIDNNPLFAGKEVIFNNKTIGELKKYINDNKHTEEYYQQKQKLYQDKLTKPKAKPGRKKA